ncbi:GNAT family N-acetyltransferase [Paenibacillus cellulositrophicus]|uniref:GNAT family N-acetyltransferase n=1 Tax=Paenibacillus cellulositrophicus TaxID=562959 RepID=UPI001266FA55|nr:GNAT family N-acetyltransferase [Paenibacillus cellulositrophicus]
MEILVTKAADSQKELLANLLQFYVYDFTEFTNIAIGEDGCYPKLPELDAYWDPASGHHPYLIKVDGEIGGFILTIEIEHPRKYSRLCHFFILRKFRRLGAGTGAAVDFLKSSSGEWELSQLSSNIPAQAFWDKVIDKVAVEGQVSVRMEKGRRYQNFIVKKG